MKDPQVIIVGAGPSGVVAAYALAQRGINVLVNVRGTTGGSIGNVIATNVDNKKLKEKIARFGWVKKEPFSLPPPRV